MPVSTGRGAAHFFWGYSASKQPEQQAEYQAEDDHAGDGKIETKILPFDDDIPGEPKQANFLQPGPCQPDHE